MQPGLLTQGHLGQAQQQERWLGSISKGVGTHVGKQGWGEEGTYGLQMQWYGGSMQLQSGAGSLQALLKSSNSLFVMLSGLLRGGWCW